MTEEDGPPRPVVVVQGPGQATEGRWTDSLSAPLVLALFVALACGWLLRGWHERRQLGCLERTIRVLRECVESYRSAIELAEAERRAEQRKTGHDP